ncbi:hypothetical protein AGMMS50222_10220 [Endomicrobiia bacterium]|nr:hypothetical protein AGMMS49531_05340 [Endomicrobiia bacterium]GHT76955.1 hypothetical protein AGMMS50222_10220 [Endomicrobiia bacterium]
MPSSSYSRNYGIENKKLKTKEEDNVDFIFSTLEETKTSIFIYLILYLLRLFSNFIDNGPDVIPAKAGIHV